MRWSTDIQNFDNVSIDDAKFIFSQAEKRLDDTVKVSDAITSRSYTIITLLVGILSAISSLFLKNLIERGFLYYQTTLTLVSVIYLTGCLSLLIWNISATQYWTLGSDPKLLAQDIFFKDGVTEKLRSVYLYVNEIENYQERIEINLQKNRTRFVTLRNVIRTMFLLPFLLIIVNLFL